MTDTPKSVCFVIGTLPGSGAERVALNLISCLDRSAFDVHIVVIRENNLKSQIDASVIELARSNIRSALFALGAALARVQPDVVVSNLGHINLATLVMSCLRVPKSKRVIREANTPSLELPSHRRGYLLKSAYRLFYPLADAVLCPSQQIRDELRSNFGIDESKLRLLSNPVDITPIREACWPSVRHPGDGLRLVTVCRLTAAKALDRLIDVLSHLPDSTHLTIIGDGPARDSLVAQAKASGVGERIDFTGHLTKPWPLVAGADRFVMTSRFEGMPNAALEALACGTPVVAGLECGGLVELAKAHDGSVTLVPVDQEFVSHLLSITPDPPVSPRRSLLPARFGTDHVSREFVGLLNSLTTQ